MSHSTHCQGHERDLVDEVAQSGFLGFSIGLVVGIAIYLFGVDMFMSITIALAVTILVPVGTAISVQEGNRQVQETCRTYHGLRRAAVG